MFDRWGLCSSDLLFLGAVKTKVSTDIDMSSLSPQEAAFGWEVRLFHFLSKSDLPLQRASAVKVRERERTEELKTEKQVGGTIE